MIACPQLWPNPAQTNHALRWLRRGLWGAMQCAVLGTTGACATDGLAQGSVHITGVVWQPHGLNRQPQGNWDRLGARQLLVQWQAVDDLPVDVTGPENDVPPDWQRIGREPWAREVILGLAGRFQETHARTHAVALAHASASMAAKPPKGLNVVGWYFPVEFDPTWAVPPALVAALATLPRPLWVSLYDNTNVGAPELVAYLKRWLPADVGVLWQDGVGVHARNAEVAGEHATALVAHLGKHRLKIIAEAFRTTPGGFRPATVDELRGQLARYAAFDVLLFEGPTYVSNATVAGLMAPPLQSREPRPEVHFVGDQ